MNKRTLIPCLSDYSDPSSDTILGCSYYVQVGDTFVAPAECDTAADTMRLPLWLLIPGPPTLTTLMDLEALLGVLSPTNPGLAPLDSAFWPTASAVCQLYLDPTDDALLACAEAAQRASLAIHLQGRHTGLERHVDLGILITL